MNRVLLVSDIHLTSARPAVADAFVTFLDRTAAGASALYILGDLFDYWVGDDELQAADADPLIRRVTGALSRRVGAGTPVWFMRGNRDFLIGDRFAEATGVRLLTDPAVAVLAGQSTLLMHGDTLCTDDTDYQDFRRSVRSPAWGAAFLARPLVERRGHMQMLRARSEQVKRHAPPRIMDVNPEAVRGAFETHRVQRFVHGHTHRPGHHDMQIGETPCKRWVLPDWTEDSHGYLIADDAGLNFAR